MKKALLLTTIFILSTSAIKPQDECCGLGSIMGFIVQSGISGGYGIQNFNAEGLNHYVDVYNQNRPSLNKKMDQFGSSKGFKIGLNAAQFLVEKWIFSLRFQYQWTNEKNSAEATLPAGGNAVREFDLTLTQLSLGMTLSYYISKRLDLKILDLMGTLNGVSLINRYKDVTTTTEEKLKNANSSFGVNVGAGFTFYIIPPYLAIETTAGYALFSIDEIEFEKGGNLARDENPGSPLMDNFITSGGFFAFAQLNVAIPL